MVLKILNLYAGIGGNRKLWSGDIEVTAVEINPEIAKIYQDFFPNDKVIIADAHQYLLEHYKEFDFIWSSPPCPSHSRIRKVTHQQNKPIYPDMKLYEEILFLQGYFKGKFVVENVRAWYKPLIQTQEIAKHWLWANFNITPIDCGERGHTRTVPFLEQRKGFDLSKFHKINKLLALRNCVEPETGLHVFNCAFKEKQQTIWS